MVLVPCSDPPPNLFVLVSCVNGGDEHVCGRVRTSNMLIPAEHTDFEIERGLAEGL